MRDTLQVEEKAEIAGQKPIFPSLSGKDQLYDLIKVPRRVTSHSGISHPIDFFESFKNYDYSYQSSIGPISADHTIVHSQNRENISEEVDP